MFAIFDVQSHDASLFAFSSSGPALQVQLTWDDDDPKRSVLKGDKYDASS